MNALYRIMLPYMKTAAASGSFEPLPGDPEHARRAADGVRRAFATNEAIDDGSSMSEPGVVSGGLKIAAGISLPKTPGIKPPKPSTSLTKSTTSLPKPPDNPLDNLKDVSHGAQASASITASARRAQGSPL